MASEKESESDKAIVISEAAGERLASHLAKLALPGRALSLPVEDDATASLPNFVELWGETRALRAAIEDWPYPARAWLVREFVPIPYERTWASGEASPGVRMVSTVHRRAGMSLADFEAHWRGPHTEIAKSYTVPVWHYVQNIVTERLGPDSGEDGFVGMHFRTTDDLRARWQDHPDEAARGAADAAKFMDLDRGVSMTAVETVWEGDSP